MADRLAVARQAGGAVGQVAAVLLLADGQAEVGLRAETVHALTALGGEQGHDAIPGREAGDVLADAFDDSGALVAQHGRRIAGWVHARRGVHVGVADAAGLQTDEHLTCARLRQLDLGDLQRLTEFLQDGGPDLHLAAPLARVGRGTLVGLR